MLERTCFNGWTFIPISDILKIGSWRISVRHCFWAEGRHYRVVVMGATVKPVEFSTIKAKLRAHICINKKAKYSNLEQSLTKVKKSFRCTLARLKQCSELMSVSTKKAKSLIFEFRTKFLYSPAYIFYCHTSIYQEVWNFFGCRFPKWKHFCMKALTVYLQRMNAHMNTDAFYILISSYLIRSLTNISNHFCKIIYMYRY